MIRLLVLSLFWRLTLSSSATHQELRRAMNDNSCSDHQELRSAMVAKSCTTIADETCAAISSAAPIWHESTCQSCAAATNNAKPIWDAGTLSCISSEESIFDYHFDDTDADAWEDGDSLSSGGDILAQNSWVIGNLDGHLHAFSNGNYQQAVFFTPATFLFKKGDTLTLDTSFRVNDRDAWTGEKRILRVGFRNQYNKGSPDIGVEIFAHNLFSFKINDISTSSTRIPIDDIDNQFHDLSLVITKSETLNTFDMSASWDGGKAIDYIVINAGIYSADIVYAVLGSRQNNAVGTTGIWIDSFSMKKK